MQHICDGGSLQVQLGDKAYPNLRSTFPVESCEHWSKHFSSRQGSKVSEYRSDCCKEINSSGQSENNFTTTRCLHHSVLRICQIGPKTHVILSSKVKHGRIGHSTILLQIGGADWLLWLSSGKSPKVETMQLRYVRTVPRRTRELVRRFYLRIIIPLRLADVPCSRIKLLYL